MANRGCVVHVRGTFGALSHCRRGPLRDMSQTPSSVFNKILYSQNFAGFAHTDWKMLHNRGGIVGASCMFRGRVARCGTIGEDLSAILGDWLLRF